MHTCIYTYIYIVYIILIYVYLLYIYTEECGDPVEAHA